MVGWTDGWINWMDAWMDGYNPTIHPLLLLYLIKDVLC